MPFTALGILTLEPSCRSLARERLDPIREWACVYGAEADPKLLRSFDLLIIEPDSPPPLSEYTGLTLAYLSLGEVNRSRSYFDRVPKRAPNPSWPGAFRIDLENGVWHRMVLQEILPSLQVYDGVFVDTVDSAADQKREMLDLLRDVRRALSRKILLVNNPESWVDQIDCDAVMAESLFTRFDFQSRTYGRANPLEAEERARRYQGRLVFSLEYAVTPADVEFALRRAREFGFVPYVTTIDLQRPTTFHRRPR